MQYVRRFGLSLVITLALSACNLGRTGGNNPVPDGGMGPPDLKPLGTTVVIAPGAPSDAPAKFGGPEDSSKAPELVYPSDGVVVPANLNILEIHFQPGGNSLFEIAFSSSGLNLKIYTKCTALGSGCSFLPDEATWKHLSNGGRGQIVNVTLRGTDGSGGAVGVSKPRTIGFSAEDIEGGIYYWAAKTGGVYRYDFGLRGQKAENYYTPQQAGGGTMCVGCHALGKSGTRIAVGLNAPVPASTMRILDVATRKTLYELAGGGFGMGGSNYQAISPDGNRIVTVEGAGLTLRDATSGMAIGASPAVANANMPDFSPDGKQVVFARGAGGGCQFGFCDTLNVQSGGIFVVPFNNDTFGAAKQLIAPGTGGNNYYPSFSPDGKWVIFNRSGMASYDAPDARVYAVSANGGNGLHQMTLDGNGGNSWPKVAPYVHHVAGTTIFWVTFSSRRAYGLKPSGGVSQIWMAAINVDKLGSGQDGSHPAFWLPFQDPATGNHIAQWTEKVNRAPCSDIDQSGCMPGEICKNGVCQPGIM